MSENCEGESGSAPAQPMMARTLLLAFTHSLPDGVSAQSADAFPVWIVESMNISSIFQSSFQWKNEFCNKYNTCEQRKFKFIHTFIRKKDLFSVKSKIYWKWISWLRVCKVSSERPGLGGLHWPLHEAVGGDHKTRKNFSRFVFALLFPRRSWP